MMFDDDNKDDEKDASVDEFSTVSSKAESEDAELQKQAMNKIFENGSPSTGIHALLNSAMGAFEKLPMLEVIFDRLVRLLSTSLRNFTSENVDINVKTLGPQRFDDFLGNIELPSFLIIFRALEWDNYGIMHISNELMYTLVDILMGGKSMEGNTVVDGRPYTPIEISLMEHFVSIVLLDMNIAFSPVTNVNFDVERTEVDPRFATIARPTDAVMTGTLDVHLQDKAGHLTIMMPYATMDTVKNELTQMFIGEKFDQDLSLENYFTRELKRMNIQLDAVLAEVSVPLEETLQWKPGSVLPLYKNPAYPIEIRAEEIPLFSALMGEHDKNVAVKVLNEIERDD